MLFDGGTLVSLTGIPVEHCQIESIFSAGSGNYTMGFPVLFWFNLHLVHELRLIWRLAGGVSSCPSFPSFALL